MDFNLDSAIRKVPDFPKKGILFYDVTGILVNPEAFSYCIDRLYEAYKGRDITKLACIDARGFVFGAPLALRLGIPLVLVRKKGKLPNKVMEQEFALEYGTDTITIQEMDVEKGDRFLVVDDLLATGGTVEACAKMIERAGAEVSSVAGIIGLPFLGYPQLLKKYDLNVLQLYNGE